MKFHRISLRDYRGIRRLSFEPAETGVTIIQGDNEVGKSSIAEALWLIFEQHDDSASQAVRAVRPVDRDAASEIEVEVSTGPYRFTYFKRFHRGPRTELRIRQPRLETLTGREADQRAKQILGETIDVALWKALRFQQGVSEDLEQLPAGKHQSLLAALDAASDLLGGAREQSLYERVQQEYDRYFTASGRERAAGQGENAVRLRQARDSAAATLQKLTERIITLEARALRASVLDGEIAAVQSRRAALASQQEELAQADEARRRQAALVDNLALEVRACEAIQRELESAAADRKRQVELHATRSQEAGNLRAELTRLAGPIVEAAESLDSARARFAAAEAELAARRSEAALAEERVHLATAAFTAQTMAERLERLEKNAPEMDGLRGWLRDCRLDPRALAALREADERVKALAARRDAEGAAVEIASEAAVELEINGKPVRIEAGTARRGTVLGESRIALPGGVTITVRAGTAARELDARATKAREDLDRLLSAAGVDSVAAAEEVVRERAAAEARLRGLEEQVAADLRDLPSIAELRAKLERQRASVEESRRPDEPIPTLDDAKSARQAAVSVLSAAQEAADAARKDLEQATTLAADRDRERERLADAAARLDSEAAALAEALSSARAEVPDEQLAARLREATGAADEATRRLAAARAELEALRDVSGELASLQAELQTLDARALALAEERAQIQGVLEDAGADGLHGQLAEAEQQLADVEAELESYLNRANAARTLFETLKRHRDAARENYAGPLKQKIEDLGKLAYGEDFSVELSEDLRVVRRTQRGVTLEVAQLSTGAREQLSVLTRLACASLVSESGGAPLILDDIFGWADPRRLRTLGPILARAAAETQVLVFTCTPSRFESVAPARVISLPSGQCEDRPAPGCPAGALTPAPDSATESPPRRAPARPQPQGALDLFPENEPAGSV